MFKKMKMITVLSLVLLSLGLTACETMDGAGRDIEKAGEAVQDAAE